MCSRRERQRGGNEEKEKNRVKYNRGWREGALEPMRYVFMSAPSEELIRSDGFRRDDADEKYQVSERAMRIRSTKFWKERCEQEYQVWKRTKQLFSSTKT